MLLARYAAALTLMATMGFEVAVAQGQPAQVEAVPELQGFDMFDLESLDDDAIALPGDEAIGLPELESLEIAPPKTDTTDPCRHLDEEQRRRLTMLCGPSS